MDADSFAVHGHPFSDSDAHAILHTLRSLVDCGFSLPQEVIEWLLNRLIEGHEQTSVKAAGLIYDCANTTTTRAALSCTVAGAERSIPHRAHSLFVRVCLFVACVCVPCCSVVSSVAFESAMAAPVASDRVSTALLVRLLLSLVSCVGSLPSVS
jgi:hypothetical protein